jgi:hypothetical protein
MLLACSMATEWIVIFSWSVSQERLLATLVVGLMGAAGQLWGHSSTRQAIWPVNCREEGCRNQMDIHLDHDSHTIDSIFT